MARILDARTADLPTEIQAGICIVGAGAAGITLAVELARAGLQVLVLESGNMQLEGGTQRLYEMKQTGLRYFDMTTCRLRYFGGTTNHWGGYCRENDPIDYEGRPDIGVPAWPILYRDILPYVKRAGEFLGLSREGFDPLTNARAHNVSPGDLIEAKSSKFTTKVFQIARRRRVHDLYEEDLKRYSSIDILLNANVVHIQLSSDGGRVVSVDVRVIGGKSCRIRAGRFVLTTHAVEAARLLLASNDVHKEGIGNRHDHVGRYFMEHPQVVSGLMFPTENFPRLYNYHWALRHSLNANLGFSEEVLRAEDVLQYYCRFVPVYEHDLARDAVRHLKKAFWSPADISAIKSLGAVLGDVPNAMRFVSSRMGMDTGRIVAFRLDHRIEQAPNPSSRIVLTDELDDIGVRKAVLHWELNDLDFHTFRRSQQVLVDEFTRLGLARFDAPDLTADMVKQGVKGHYHHIGTTRMSSDPRNGVVDANCRVHGIDNLYVCGSGIFPTSGYSGPTMMIFAFAMRLADHLVAQRG